jgi:hypothetical protein
MTNDDKYLRDLFACFAIQKITWKKGEETEDAQDCYVIADAMMEARNKEKDYAEKGITAIKKRTATRKMD